jgi:hypothetical protein
MDAPAEYKNFIGTIKERIRSAQYEALKAEYKDDAIWQALSANYSTGPGLPEYYEKALP